VLTRCRIQAQKGKIAYWVRNLVCREGRSFFLQKATGRFYPDFLCHLPDKTGKPGPILAVEYKGGDRWKEAEDDRLTFAIWANLSDSRCRLILVTNQQFEQIEPQLDLI